MTVHAKHDDWWCECGERLDDNEVCPKGERAPSYAGHEAHPCPVCLNVHGGETGKDLKNFQPLDVLDRAVPKANFGEVPRCEVMRSILTAIHEQGAAITERSAT